MIWPVYLNGLYALLAFGVAGWLLSLYRNNVTHVDSMWSLFLLLAGVVYANQMPEISDRSQIILIFLSLWALRLSIYLTWRNWGPHEDHRYAEIRRNNSPHFGFKSLYIVFGLQAILAWVISLPILGAVVSPAELNFLDIVGIAVVSFGLIWETVADWQLSVFKSRPENQGQVLDRGLWRHCRHPNYFGECCVWWGFFIMALAAGAWWALPSALLMTFLLLKFSGVALLEKDIGDRRPAYAQYVRTTNAFIPGCKKKIK